MNGAAPPGPGGPPPGWVNTPVQIDRDGRFWNEGEEIVHDRLLLFLRQHLRPVPGTDHWEIYVSERERKPVEIADAPYQVLSCWGSGGNPPSMLHAVTYDGAEEAVDPSTIEIRHNVPYCRVKNGTALGRFSRQAAESLSRYYAEEDDQVVLRMKDRDYVIGDL